MYDPYGRKGEGTPYRKIKKMKHIAVYLNERETETLDIICEVDNRTRCSFIRNVLLDAFKKFKRNNSEDFQEVKKKRQKEARNK